LISATIRIAALLFLDFMPRLLLRGGLHLLFTGMHKEVNLLTLGLGCGVPEVRIGHGLVHNLRTFTLSHLFGEA
jgi:hypothetical protein